MNILITGASSGFGKLIVAELLKAGHKVAGTVRDPQGRNAEAADLLRDLGAEIVDIDVTDDASVEAGVTAASSRLGGIDVLINNAGVGVHGLQENFSAAVFQRVFDINVFGPQRMMRAVLPQMRARGEGLILNVTSVLGRVTLPFYGPYNATKWALEAVSENYRAELSQFGVDVAIVEPGGFPTEFHGNLILPSSTDRNEGYGEMAGAPVAARQQMNEFLAANPQQNPSLVAEAVVSVVDAVPGMRPFRTEVDTVGMGDLVKPMNDLAATSTEALFTNFGLADMLKLNVAARKAA
ncbi:SDR family oxidoreductase [Tropicibacter sp. R16_0]|uniref:SDR family oxidoreductase n=1 Tax=Tropicibacter sp. R16_0 TaxID=2821102 RepID=UPI001ADA1079|nr:SDR family oxidoreductase [Tropicibacter sp. R16_0]MBO9453405.1 SDR family oxidoreductase [Tropicibacter sp. R16_0]